MRTYERGTWDMGPRVVFRGRTGRYCSNSSCKKNGEYQCSFPIRGTYEAHRVYCRYHAGRFAKKRDIPMPKGGRDGN